MIKSTNIIREQSQSDKPKLNVLFVGDQEIKERSSFAKRLLASRQVTGDVKFKYQGNSDKLLELLQSNIAESFDLVIFFCSGVYESKEYIETIENFEIAISLCRNLDIPFLTFTFPKYTYLKNKKQADRIKELEPYRTQINAWIKNSSGADFVVDLDFRLDERQTFFTAYGDKISTDGHAATVRRIIPILKELDNTIQDSQIDTSSINKLISGSSLTKIQKLLVKLGYKIDPEDIRSNIFGLSTKTAVANFQLKNGLLPSGDIDLKTVKRLKSRDAIEFSSPIAGTGVLAAQNKERPKHIRTYKHMSGGSEINRQVFLDAIAYAEGTANYPNDGYYTLFTGKQFDSLDQHPNISVCAPVKGKQICSTAAGRYGFLYSTWQKLGYSDFSESNQDAGALDLLSPTLLQAVDDGEWETVFTGANGIWASFPGDKYGQGGKSMDQMLEFVEKRIEELGGEVTKTDDEGNIIDDLGNVIKTAGAGLLALGTIATINYAHKLDYNPSSGFKTAARPKHAGIDYHASKGTPVVLAQAGKIVKTHTGCGDAHDAKGAPIDSNCGGGWGNHVQIRFDDGAYCIFAHFTDVSVSPGQEVEAGTVIGTVGDTGQSYGAHLHFEYIAPGSSVKSAGTPDIAENYFGFGHGGTQTTYTSPNDSTKTTSDSTKTTKITKQTSKISKSIVIGDSLSPNVARQCDADLIDTSGGASVLWESGKATSWLSTAVSNFNLTTSIKNIVICIGTNDIYKTSAPIESLVSNLRMTFPNAKLLVVQGTYGNKVNWSKSLQTVTQKQVDAFYARFANMGVTVITPAIGNVPNAHDSLPIYRTIGANINKNLK